MASGLGVLTAAICWFSDSACHRVEVAGGKGASLSRMTAAGLAVPAGFVVRAEVLAGCLDAPGAREELAGLLAGLDVERPDALRTAAQRIQRLIDDLPMPPGVETAIAAAYDRLTGGEEVPVAVRSSAAAEDSKAASFAGQQQTFLNVSGAADVLARVRACWASLFGDRAIFYRGHKGSLADAAMAVVVQRLIVPEKAGVLFTVDPIERRRDRMVIEATWGYGEAVVSGLVVPDNYLVTRPDGRVVRATIPHKPIALVRDDVRGGLVERAVPPDRTDRRVLSDEEVAELVALGLRVEAFFGDPQDVEWGIEDGRLFLLQSRPVTTL